MSKTKIEWADLTINPIIGCSKCSPGCANCYAEKMAIRLAGHSGKVGERYQSVVWLFPECGHGWNGSTVVDYSCFDHLPKNPARIFVGSMGDVFHHSVKDATIHEIVSRAKREFRHTFLFLTKRAERMRDVLSGVGNVGNIWAGVTVCNQAEADEKVPILLSTPAAKRFVSVEPMLGPVDLTQLPGDELAGGNTAEKNALTGKLFIVGNCGQSSQMFNGKRLDWVICGGETGPGARSMDVEWARDLLFDCRLHGVPFFFKKMSGKAPTPDDLMVREVPE